MNGIGFLRMTLLFAVGFALCLVGIGCAGDSTTASTTASGDQSQAQPMSSAPSADQGDQDEELQMGQEVYNELKGKAEIIESSPLYDNLRPFADSITRAAQPQYNHPFKFYLVHEPQPNAFAAPGG